MMRNFIYLLVILTLSGCGVVYSDIKQAYVDAKVIYSDTKYVVYEIKDEIDNLKDGKDANQSR